MFSLCCHIPAHPFTQPSLYKAPLQPFSRLPLSLFLCHSAMQVQLRTHLQNPPPASDLPSNRPPDSASSWPVLLSSPLGARGPPTRTCSSAISLCARHQAALPPSLILEALSTIIPVRRRRGCWAGLCAHQRDPPSLAGPAITHIKRGAANKRGGMKPALDFFRGAEEATKCQARGRGGWVVGQQEERYGLVCRSGDLGWAGERGGVLGRRARRKSPRKPGRDGAEGHEINQRFGMGS